PCCASSPAAAARSTSGRGRPTRRRASARCGRRTSWIALSWRIDPDGALGIRKYFESPYRPGERLGIDEFYRWIFQHSVPGLPEAAAKLRLTPLDYMRRHGAFLVEDGVYATHEKTLGAKELDGATVDPVTRVVSRGGHEVGVEIDGVARVGFPTPSRKL